VALITDHERKAVSIRVPYFHVFDATDDADELHGHSTHQRLPFGEAPPEQKTEPESRRSCGAFRSADRFSTQIVGFQITAQVRGCCAAGFSPRIVRTFDFGQRAKRMAGPDACRAARHGRDESIMLEAIVLLLSLATCALILVAFWGLDLLRR
jgi:hypothetical protein